MYRIETTVHANVVHRTHYHGYLVDERDVTVYSSECADHKSPAEAAQHIATLLPWIPDGEIPCVSCHQLVKTTEGTVYGNFGIHSGTLCDYCAEETRGACSAIRTAKPCVSCGEPTVETVRGRIGDQEGMLCANCQYYCDGNIIVDDD